MTQPLTSKYAVDVSNTAVSVEESPSWGDVVRHAEQGETVPVNAHGKHVADVVPSGELERLGLNKLSLEVAAALYERLTGPVIGNPYRLGTPLDPPYDGVWIMRRGEYRALYTIDDDAHVVTVVRWDIAATSTVLGSVAPLSLRRSGRRGRGAPTPARTGNP